MYMNHQSQKHDERAEEKQRKIEAYKKFRYHKTRDGENSTGNSGCGKFLILSL